jgi:hypothetical protein
MQIPVLPRDVAGQIITSSVSRMGWAVGFVTIVITIPVLIETLTAHGRSAELPTPVATLLLILGAIVLVVVNGRPWAVFAFLAVAGAASVVYEVSLLRADPELLDHWVFLINRPAVALVAVGVTALNPLVGVLWTTLGYLVSLSVTFTVSAITNEPLVPGLGPTLVYGMLLIAYLTLAGIQVAQRRRLPDFEALEAETRRLAHGEDLSRKTTAMVHDTVLNDLSLVINGPEKLSEAARKRLLDDLETLRSADWLDSTTSFPTWNVEDATLRNDISRVINDFQWRGLSVHVTGFGTFFRIDPPVAEAVISAVRACFENVLRHSGSNVAEFEVVYSGDAVTVMVTDRGRGFDQDAVPADRLGLRGSVIDRVEAVGGHVQIWTTPGEGTSVVITAPARPIEAFDRSAGGGGR